jgi:hypothetical protein
MEQPYPIIGAGQDFMVVFGPAPTGYVSQGWFLLLDTNGNTESRSGYAPSQSGPYNFSEFTAGDFIVRAGGEFNPVTPSVSIDLTPTVTPITVPASGGSFDFTVEANNNEPDSIWVNIWTDVQMPDSSIYGPVLGPANLVLSPGTRLWLRTQIVPAAAPPGVYTYNGYVGLYPNVLWDVDSFPFEKLAGGDGKIVADWSNWGDELGAITSDPAATSSELLLCKNYPNPFNPTTAIGYQLTANSYVYLTIYDTAGKLVQTIVNGWRHAGFHEATFDGIGLPSGVYIYSLRAGQRAGVGKMLLVK